MRICAVVSFVAAKLRIVTIRIMSVRQPARMEQLDCHWMDFDETILSFS
jgi:hypothetical protein